MHTPFPTDIHSTKPWGWADVQASRRGMRLEANFTGRPSRTAQELYRRRAQIRSVCLPFVLQSTRAHTHHIHIDLNTGEGVEEGPGPIPRFILSGTKLAGFLDSSKQKRDAGKDRKAFCCVQAHKDLGIRTPEQASSRLPDAQPCRLLCAFPWK